MKVSTKKHKTSASGHSKLDPLGFVTRNKIPTMPSWRTTDLIPASQIELGQGEGFGIDCERNGLVVVDPDTQDALTAFGDLWKKHEGTRRLRTYAVKTPHGHHFYFNAIEGLVVRNSVSRLAPNLDIRGVGGFVNAPPTPGYRVLLRGPVRDLPEWLAHLLVAPRPKRSNTDGLSDARQHSLGGLIATLANARPGTRNNILYWCLCRVAEMPEHEQRSALWSIRQEALVIGLDDCEIEKTIASAFGARHD